MDAWKMPRTNIYLCEKIAHNIISQYYFIKIGVFHIINVLSLPFIFSMQATIFTCS
jgi:hypothetical protein